MHSESLVPPKLRTSLLHFPYPDAFPLVLLLQLSQWVNNLLCGIHYKVAYKLLVNNSYELSRIWACIFYYFLGMFGKNCNVCFGVMLDLQFWKGWSMHLHMNGWSMKAQWPQLVSPTTLRLVLHMYLFFFFIHHVWTLIWSSGVKKGHQMMYEYTL